jgi:hypothetical protein
MVLEESWEWTRVGISVIVRRHASINVSIRLSDLWRVERQEHERRDTRRYARRDYKRGGCLDEWHHSRMTCHAEGRFV